MWWTQRTWRLADEMDVADSDMLDAADMADVLDTAVAVDVLNTADAVHMADLMDAADWWI